ncbi:hypothetical protein [Microbacterium sp. MYb62]|uniref:hypothetical protein n=1 Tax=Microbacterium sp. MYb62 TaxID=1848690 RepID=UPI000CFC6890|nr:hypothetical protein [Microbacterium sp. MYb62]PRB17308.1 hypothetical protein CQ042_05805 [Microbacterium sp. MYb62]
MTASDDRISDYLTRYADSLTAFDAETAAGLWSAPGMIVNDRTSGVLDSRDAMVDGLRQSYPIYQRLGLASVGFELLERRDLSDRLALVRVRWLFFDAGGAQLTDTDSYYLLRDEAEGLQACVCVETDAAQKLQALAAERGVDLTSLS